MIKEPALRNGEAMIVSREGIRAVEKGLHSAQVIVGALPLQLVLQLPEFGRLLAQATKVCHSTLKRLKELSSPLGTFHSSGVHDLDGPHLFARERIGYLVHEDVAGVEIIVAEIESPQVS